MESITEPHLTNYLLEICGYSGIELQMTEVLPDGDWRTVLHGVENAYVISEFPATGKLFRPLRRLDGDRLQQAA